MGLYLFQIAQNGDGIGGYSVPAGVVVTATLGDEYSASLCATAATTTGAAVEPDAPLGILPAITDSSSRLTSIILIMTVTFI
jgi:hypothetical protein